MSGGVSLAAWNQWCSKLGERLERAKDVAVVELEGER